MFTCHEDFKNTKIHIYKYFFFDCKIPQNKLLKIYILLFYYSLYYYMSTKLALLKKYNKTIEFTSLNKIN